MLIFQILFEFIVRYIIKQIDYFRLAIKLDANESSAPVQSIYSAINHIDNLQEDAIATLGEDLYSPEEKKMIKEIQIEAIKYKYEKEEKQNALKKIIKSNKKHKFPFFKSKKK